MNNRKKKKEKPFEIGSRVYHKAFGWGTIRLYFPGSPSMVIDLDAPHIEYYVMGKGRVVMEAEESGKNIWGFNCPSKEVVSHPDKMQGTDHLFATALGAVITYPEGYVPDHEK